LPVTPDRQDGTTKEAKVEMIAETIVGKTVVNTETDVRTVEMIVGMIVVMIVGMIVETTVGNIVMTVGTTGVKIGNHEMTVRKSMIVETNGASDHRLAVDETEAKPPRENQGSEREDQDGTHRPRISPRTRCKLLH
jgi:hypothetical protein